MTRASGEKGWSECQALLVNDRGQHVLATSSLLRSGGYGRRLETTHALESVGLLERWLKGNPRIRACDEDVALPLQVRSGIEAALEQFKRVAIAAGTRPPAAPAPVEAPAPPPEGTGEPVLAPADAGPSSAVTPDAGAAPVQSTAPGAPDSGATPAAPGPATSQPALTPAP